MNHFNCYFKKDLFCFLCGNYIRNKKDRHIFNKESKSFLHFKIVYNFSPDIRHSYQPSKICSDCLFNLKNVVLYDKRLRYSKPATFKHPDNKHSNCYLCNITLPTSNLKNQIGKLNICLILQKFIINLI